MLPDAVTTLRYLARPPLRPASGRAPLLLLMHGLGNNEAEMFALAPLFNPRLYVVAPRGPLTLRPGAYAWTHATLTPGGPFDDPEEAEASRVLLARFLGELVAAHDLDAARVYLGGFSQGAAMALALALTQPGAAAGIVAMGGGIMPRYLPPEGAGLPLEGLPVFVAHGTDDIVVPVEHARATRATLERIGARVTYREYAMGHEMTSESLGDAARWLAERLER